MLIYKFNDAIQLATKYINADTVFAFQGGHGIGKSLGLKKLADKLGLGFVDLRLSLFEEGDLIGLPYRDGSDTKYSKPIWLKLIEEQYREKKFKGLLCLEELNRCDTLVRTPALQLLWDRKCSHFDLPNGWLPVATWNPSGEGYETEELDDALLSRLVVINVAADVDSWIAYALEEGLNGKVIQFLRNNPKYFLNTDLKLTPRTWSLVANLVDKYPGDVEVLKPLLGVELSVLFYSSWEVDLAEEYIHGRVFSDDLLCMLIGKPPEQVMSFLGRLKKKHEASALKLVTHIKTSSLARTLVGKLNGVDL